MDVDMTVEMYIVETMKALHEKYQAEVRVVYEDVLDEVKKEREALVKDLDSQMEAECV